MANLTRGQKVRLGAFVGTALAVLAAATLVLAGRALTENRDAYTIRFSSKAASFSGLSIGSDVTYSGIKIGRVDKLGVAPDDVSVILVGVSLQHGTPIAVDSKASLGSQGITGMKYIDISRGSAKVALRKPGDTIPAGESLIDELSAKAMAIGEKLDALMVNLQAMTGASAQHNVQEILDQAAGLLSDNRAHIATIVANAARISDDMAQVSHDLAIAAHSGVAVVDRADKLMSDVELGAADARKLLAPTGNVVVTLKKFDTLVSGLNMVVVRSQGDVDVTLRHLRDAAADMRDFAQSIKDNPTLLLLSSDRSSDKRIGR